jgi:hypothetical protein
LDSLPHFRDYAYKQSPILPIPKTEKYLFQDFFPVVKRAFRRALENRVRSDYRLVKLKTETVNELRKLKDQTAQAGLNRLIKKMIQLRDAYRPDSGLIIPLGC